MPAEGVDLTPKDHVLTTEEIVQLVRNRLSADSQLDPARCMILGLQQHESTDSLQRGARQGGATRRVAQLSSQLGCCWNHTP